MKSARLIALILATTLVTMVSASPAKADVDVSFGFFYSNLRPYGDWVVSAEYGRVWQPDVYDRGWNPYYDGHWVATDLGWTWVSDYAWGGIPYHYGTWVLDPRFGWVWVPGYAWAPSWVVFRTGPDYIGWAPVSPGYSIGASFSFGDPDLFVFVRAGDFLTPRLRTRVIPIEQSRTFIRNTTIVNNIRIENDVVVNRGPDLRSVEGATGRKIDVTPIDRVRRVGPSDRISRDDLRVRGDRGTLRAAEPMRADQPLPREERSSIRDDRRTPSQERAEPRRTVDRRRPTDQPAPRQERTSRAKEERERAAPAPSRRADQPASRDEQAARTKEDRERTDEAKKEDNKKKEAPAKAGKKKSRGDKGRGGKDR